MIGNGGVAKCGNQKGAYRGGGGPYPSYSVSSLIPMARPSAVNF